MPDVSLAIAFGAGVLSFVSPCVLPLVPVYLSHLAGSAVTTSAPAPPRRTTFFHALSFVVGFSVVFVALGASVGFAGSLLTGQMPLLRKISGGILIVLGLHLIGVFRIRWLYRQWHPDIRLGERPRYLRSLLVGALFAVGWTPCIGPILGGIFTLAWSSETAWQGVYLLSFYSVGLGVPFLLAGLAVGTFTGYMRRLNRYLRVVEVVSGLLLIAMGVLIFLDILARLTGSLGGGI